jgi:hypothetical protein
LLELDVAVVDDSLQLSENTVNQSLLIS